MKKKFPSHRLNQEEATLPKRNIFKRTKESQAATPAETTAEQPQPAPTAQPILEYTETLVAADRTSSPRPITKQPRTWKRSSWEPADAVETQVDRIAVKEKATTTAPQASRPSTVDLQVDQAIEKKKKARP